jgi:hypothetical protein
MDAVHLAGDQRPGVLGTGRIEDIAELLEQGLDRMVASLDRHLRGRIVLRPPWASRDRFKPKARSGFVRGPRPDWIPRRVAVLPFRNDSSHGGAGEIVMLQVVRHLAASGTLDLLEPGLVRDALLQARVTQEGGLSLAQADALEAILRVELVLTGRVTEYRERSGAWDSPVAAFSTRVLDTSSRQALWSSFSYNRGDDRVFFFDTGRVFTAHELAFEMTRSTVDTMMRWTARKVKRARAAAASLR